MALEAVVYQQQQEELFGLNNYMINHNYYGKSSEIRELHQQQVYPFLLETCWAGNDLMMMPPSSSPTHHHHHHHDYNTYDDYHNVVIGGGSYDYLVQFHHDHHHHQGDGDNYNVDVYDHHHHHDPSFNNDDDDDQHQHQHQHEHEETTKEQEGEVGPRGVRPKRRRARAKKNKEEVENQRMTHIAVERNRRKQMNDYLNVLRSLMPDSYVPRGDQASIIGGAINFVKELEQNLQCLSAKKQMNDLNINATTSITSSSSSSLPFGEFFSFPQYSTSTTTTTSTGDNEQELKGESHHLGGGEMVADVEVSMVETHALVKIRTKQPPKQLSKLVSGLQGLRLTILHLNATKVDGVAFYSFSVKVEDESRLNSVDEIASAVYLLLVYERLAYRKIRVDGLCPRCRECPESALHALIECHASAQLIRNSEWSLLLHDAPKDDTADFFIWIMDKSHGIELIKLMAFLWALWTLRNNAVHGNESPNPLLVITGFENMVLQHHLSPRERVHNNPHGGTLSFDCWQPPPPSYVKINTDAAIWPEGAAGLGWVARDDRGTILAAGARRFKVKWDAQTAEHAAARYGVQMAQSLGYRDVVIESDALGVISALHSRKTYRNDLHHFLNDIRLIAPCFKSLLASHVKRGGNALAHYMARLGPTDGSELLYTNNFPQGVIALMEFDL